MPTLNFPGKPQGTEKKLIPSQIAFLGQSVAFGRFNENDPIPPHLVYNVANEHDGKVDGKTYYDLMAHHADDTGNRFVLLKWIPEDTDLPVEDTDTTCDMAEYFPTFEAGFARLAKLEGK